MTHEEKMNVLGTAWIRAYKAIDRLGERFDEHDVTEAERTAISLRMPTLRADRDALQARLVALAANTGALTGIGDEAYKDLREATRKLQESLTARTTATTLVALASDVLRLARGATG